MATHELKEQDLIETRRDMRKPHLTPLFGTLLFGGTLWVAAWLAIPLSASERTNHIWQQSFQWQATTAPYKKAALEVLLKGANDMARDLQLPEKLPIKAEDLVEVYIQSPYWSEYVGWFGSISTSNYHYYASIDNKLSSVIRNLGRDDVREPAYMESLKERYLAPKSQMNTNAAYKLAAKFLAAAGMDVKALKRDSKVKFITWDLGDKFVPVYYVSWCQPHAELKWDDAPPKDDGYQSVASVQLVLPEHRLLQMSIDNGRYFKRKPLVVPDRDRLLQQADDPRLREMWFTTEAYKQEALKVLLKEVNQVGPSLGLPEKFPLQSSNLKKVVIATPFISDNAGSFGGFNTKDYVYSANSGNKLSSIAKNLHYRDETPTYLYSLKTRYAAPLSQVNTTAAYLLATQWLAALSVDVKALEHDHRVIISPWNLGDGRFVPLYSVEWVRGDGVHESFWKDVTVEVLEPERSLYSLSINKPEYIKREPLVVPARDKLLGIKTAQTNAPVETNVPARQ